MPSRKHSAAESPSVRPSWRRASPGIHDQVLFSTQSEQRSHGQLAPSVQLNFLYLLLFLTIADGCTLAVTTLRYVPERKQRQLLTSFKCRPLPVMLHVSTLSMVESTVGSRFTTWLRSRIFGCKSNRRKTSGI